MTFALSVPPKLLSAFQLLWPLLHMLSVLVAATAVVQLIFSLPVAFAYVVILRDDLENFFFFF
jgi:hypothetical protein